MFENCSHCILLRSLYFITVTIFYYGYRLQMRFHVFLAVRVSRALNVVDPLFIYNLLYLMFFHGSRHQNTFYVKRFSVHL